MIIDNTKQEFNDVPDTLNGEVLLERPSQGGFITCSQEAAYMYSIATPEQLVYSGHIAHNYSGLESTVNKPSLEDVAVASIRDAQGKLGLLSIPDPVKAAMQNRINGLLVAMKALPFDEGLRLALQLPIDIQNT